MDDIRITENIFHEKCCEEKLQNLPAGKKESVLDCVFDDEFISDSDTKPVRYPRDTDIFVYDQNHCGLFQILHVILTQLTRFTAAWGMFLMSFGNYNPGWRCLTPYSHYNSSQTNGTHPQLYQYNTPPELVLNSSDEHEDKFQQLQYNLNLSLSLFYDHTCPVPETCKDVEFEPGTVTIVTQFRLICDNAHVPSIIIAIQMAGMLFGSIVAGQLGESFGRKTGIYSSTALLAVTSGLCVFSTCWQMYAVFIFGVGFGCGGILATFTIISTEFLGPKWRGRFASIPVSNIALGILGCLILACKDWVILHSITAALSALAFLGVLWVPESLLWLRIHGTPEQTAKVLRKIATVNKLPIPSKDQIVTTCLQNQGHPGKVEPKKKSTVCDLFRTELRMLTFKCVIIYSGIQLSYYTIGFGVQALPGDFYTNFLLSVLTEGPVSLLVGPACNGLGRKWASSLFTAISSLSCAAIPVMHYTLGDDVSALAIRILAIIARAMIICIVQTFNIFMIELFPTEVRSIAFGFVMCISRIGLILSPFLIPTSKSALPVSFSLLAAALLLTISCLVTLSETKHKDLSESFDIDCSSSTTTTSNASNDSSNDSSNSSTDTTIGLED